MYDSNISDIYLHLHQIHQRMLHAVQYSAILVTKLKTKMIVYENKNENEGQWRKRKRKLNKKFTCRKRVKTIKIAWLK